MTKPKFGTTDGRLEPVPYQGDILAEYHQRGATNGWRAAQSCHCACHTSRCRIRHKNHIGGRRH